MVEELLYALFSCSCEEDCTRGEWRGLLCFALHRMNGMEWRGMISVDRRKEGVEILW